jgi:hypothetical protein
VIKTVAVSDGLLIGSTGTGHTTLYCGFSLKESAAATAHVRIREGDVSGKIIDTIPFAAGEGVADQYDPAIVVSGQIYVQIVSGSVEGTIRYR